MDLEPITIIFDYDEISAPFHLNATIDLSLSFIKTYSSPVIETYYSIICLHLMR